MRTTLNLDEELIKELMKVTGAKTKVEAIRTNLTGLRFLETSFSSWKRTGELASLLRRKGITLPLSDLIIASVALEYGCRVFTLDPHFKKIPGLTLYPFPKSSRERF